jgi:hypothetical protein
VFCALAATKKKTPRSQMLGVCRLWPQLSGSFDNGGCAIAPLAVPFLSYAINHRVGPDVTHHTIAAPVPQAPGRRVAGEPLNSLRPDPACAAQGWADRGNPQAQVRYLSKKKRAQPARACAITEARPGRKLTKVFLGLARHSPSPKINCALEYGTSEARLGLPREFNRPKRRNPAKSHHSTPCGRK